MSILHENRLELDITLKPTFMSYNSVGREFKILSGLKMAAINVKCLVIYKAFCTLVSGEQNPIFINR